jgi:primase-polymerase (primpol)-like protein
MLIQTEEKKEKFDEFINSENGKTFWPVPDTTFMAMRMHMPENKTQLIDTEAYLHGWSEKVFSSDDTAKLWKRAIQKNKLKTKVKQAACLSF